MLVLELRQGPLGFVCCMQMSRPVEDRAPPVQPAAAGDAEESRRTGPETSGEEFHRLFESYFRPVYYFFLRRGIPEEDSRDLAQETFFRVYRGMAGFRGDASVQTWLFQIATNLWRNQMRLKKAVKREAREVSLEGAMEKGFQPSGQLPFVQGTVRSEPLSEVLEEEQIHLLRQALKDLPPQMRRCVLLRIDQDLRYREIASVMQISIDTVKSQLSQARDRLKKELGEYFGVPDFAKDASRHEG